MSSNWSVEVVPNKENAGMQTIRVTSKIEVEETKEYSFPTCVVNGISYPLSCSQERWNRLNSIVQYRPGDIIVATYPKCGTTWTEQVILLLLNNGEPESLNTVTKNTYDPKSKLAGKIWLEACLDQEAHWGPKMIEAATVTTEEFAAMEGRRVIKTHAPLQLVVGVDGKGLDQLPDGVKVVAVSRNPMDACVSSYYHAFNPYKSGWPFDAWASAWLSGSTVHGSWFDWVKLWYLEVQKHPQKSHFIQFEQLKTHAREEIVKLAVFLGVEYDDALIDRVLEHSSFDSMKKQADAKGGDYMGHLRKGEVGDWKNHFTAEMVQDFNAKVHREFDGTVLETMFDYSAK